MRLLLIVPAIITLFKASHAFQSIIIGESYDITAGTQVPVKITNDDNDAKAVNFTAGLYTSAGNSLICTLTDRIPISTKEFTVTIPASVGPSGFYYRIYLISYSINGGIIAPTPSYSEQFHLSSANGTLTTYEVLGPVPNQFVAEGFYSAYTPPCTAYDCWRTCLKTDPPVFKDNGQGLAQAGQIFYDQQYIECLESCPGVEKPLPTDFNDVATTTTGVGALPTASVVDDVKPDGSCKVDEGETFCGTQCCEVGVECFYWNHCGTEAVDLNSSPTPVDATASVTGGGASKTSATGEAPATKTTDGGSKNAGGKVQMPFVVSGLMGIAQLFRYF